MKTIKIGSDIQLVDRAGKPGDLVSFKAFVALFLDDPKWSALGVKGIRSTVKLGLSLDAATDEWPVDDADYEMLRAIVNDPTPGLVQSALAFRQLLPFVDAIDAAGAA